MGIDLHRRRSVIVRMDTTGMVLSTVRVLNDPVAFALAVAEAGGGPAVIVARDNPTPGPPRPPCGRA